MLVQRRHACVACAGSAFAPPPVLMARIRLRMHANLAHANSTACYDSISQRRRPTRLATGCAYNCRVNLAIKSLIVWLMLLTVPLQGFASVSKLLCAPPPVAAHVTVHASTSKAAIVAARDQIAAHEHNGDHSPHHHPDEKCGACASCCFGAAMAPSFIVGLPQHSMREIALAASVVPLASVDLELPERPPRS